MRMKKVSVLVLVAVLLLTGNVASAQSMDPNKLQSLSGKDFDIAFVRDVITNRQIDIELLRPAATNAKHAEIKTLALRLMDERQADVDKLIGWLEDWYHQQPNTSMTNTLIHMRAMPSMNMGSLNEAIKQIDAVSAASGDDYDRLVLRYMIRDHNLSLDSTTLVAERAARAELLTYAPELAASLRADIAQYSDWLRDWYQLDANGQPLPRPSPTEAALTITRVVPTATQVRPTASKVAPTATQVRPTATVVVPPDTPLPLPTATEIIVPTDTPLPTATEIIVPTATLASTATALPTTVALIVPTATPMISPTLAASGSTSPATATLPVNTGGSASGGWLLYLVIGIIVALAVGLLLVGQRRK